MGLVQSAQERITMKDDVLLKDDIEACVNYSALLKVLPETFNRDHYNTDAWLSGQWFSLEMNQCKLKYITYSSSIEVLREKISEPTQVEIHNLFQVELSVIQKDIGKIIWHFWICIERILVWTCRFCWVIELLNTDSVEFTPPFWCSPRYMTQSVIFEMEERNEVVFSASIPMGICIHLRCKIIWTFLFQSLWSSSIWDVEQSSQFLREHYVCRLENLKTEAENIPLSLRFVNTIGINVQVLYAGDG